MPKTVKTDLVLFCFKWRRANFFVILIMNTSPVSVKMGTVPLHYHHHNSSYLQSRDTNITKMSHIEIAFVCNNEAFYSKSLRLLFNHLPC